MKTAIVSMMLAGFLVACSENVTAPPSQTEIENAPEQIVVDGVELTLDVYLYRDFQPPTEPNGSALRASVRVKPAAGRALPADLRAEALHVIRGDEVWTPRLLMHSPDDRIPQLEFIAGDGPKWGPGVTVDVVMRLRRGDAPLLLKAAGQPIQRTD